MLPDGGYPWSRKHSWKHSPSGGEGEGEEEGPVRRLDLQAHRLERKVEVIQLALDSEASS